MHENAAKWRSTTATVKSQKAILLVSREYLGTTTVQEHFGRNDPPFREKRGPPIARVQICLSYISVCISRLGVFKVFRKLHLLF